MLHESQKIEDLIHLAQEEASNDRSMKKLSKMLDSRSKFKSKNRIPRPAKHRVIDPTNPYNEPLFRRVPSEKIIKSERGSTKSTDNVRRRI